MSKHHHLSSKDLSRNRITYVLILVSVVMLAVKSAAYFMSHSQAILSDALENIVNVVTAVLVFVVIRYAQKPADRDHPYGHGKVEFFSAAFEGALILFAGLLIIAQSVELVLKGYELHELNNSLWLIASTSLVNGGVGLYLVRGKNKHQSTALEASGRHLMTDAYTTIAVILGLLVYKATGIKGIDIFLAALVALHLIASGFMIVKRAFSGLMDEQDIGVIRKLKDSFERNRFEGLIQVHHLKVIRSGMHSHIDAHVVLPEFWDISKLHDKMHRFEHGVVKELFADGEMNFHFDPCRRVYCSHCNLKQCPVRQKDFISFLEFDIEDLQSPVEPAGFAKRK